MFLLAKLSPVAMSEEKRLFSQATPWITLKIVAFMFVLLHSFTNHEL